MRNAMLFDHASPTIPLEERRNEEKEPAGESVTALVPPSSSNGDSKKDESERQGWQQLKYPGERIKLATPKADEYPSGTTLAFIVIALVLSVFLSSLDITIVATAIPKITDEFNGLDKVSWYGSAFFLTNGSFQSSWGKAYKYFPLKTTFLLAISIFELGSLICGVAPSSDVLILGRAIAGLGCAGIATGGYTIIAFVTEPSRRPLFTGIVGSSYGVASVVGPLIGGAFTQKITWRWCFYINLPIGAISVLIILFFFHAPRGVKPIAASWKEKFLQMDLVGVALMMGALLSYSLAVQYGGQTKPWSSSEVIGLLVGSFSILIVFGVWEYSLGERAMIVARLLTQPTVCVSSIFAFLFGGSYFLVIYYLPIYFQSIKNVGPALSGVYNLPLIIATTVAIISAGMFITATGHAIPVQVCGAAIAVLGSGLLFTLDIDTSMGKWIGFQILGAVGWGSAFQIPIMVGQGNAEAEDMSCVTAIILFFLNAGGSLLLSAAQSAFVNRMIASLRISAPGLDPATVVATGATQIRAVFTAAQVPGILVAYVAAIKAALALSIGASGVAFVSTFFNRWKKLGQDAVRSTSSTG